MQGPVVFVFVRQKTAYEMRISDWSSDVSSSDLVHPRTRRARGCSGVQPAHDQGQGRQQQGCAGPGRGDPRQALQCLIFHVQLIDLHGIFVSNPGWARSEEHTSELQSLMRISYAVFCLKKKNTHT